MSAIAQDLAHARLLERLAPAMRAAGRLIEELKAAGIVHRSKADKSAVTEADEASERLLAAALRELDPDAIIIGEEASAAGIRPEPGARFWLIDPLDGTNGFVRGRSDYAVNVGLVEDGVPTVGLILHPPTQTLWTGAIGLGAWKEGADGERHAIRTRPLGDPVAIATSHSHLDRRTQAWVDAVPGAVISPSSSSLKFCLLAEGLQDAYPRYGPTCEWDTAAGDAILRAAGGIVLGTDGKPFPYPKPESLNGPFLALGDPAAAAKLPPLPPA